MECLKRSLIQSTEHAQQEGREGSTVHRSSSSLLVKQQQKHCTKQGACAPLELFGESSF